VKIFYLPPEPAGTVAVAVTVPIDVLETFCAVVVDLGNSVYVYLEGLE
jgi:hypothetical protein